MGLKDMFFEKEEPKAPDKVPKPQSVAAPWNPTPSPLSSGLLISTAAAVSRPNGIYERLLQCTDFDSTKEGATLLRYLKPLMALPIEEHAKYKAAMAQAEAQEHLTAQGVNGAFLVLKDQLEGEHKAFLATLDSKNQDVAHKNQQLRDLKEQCAKLEAEVADLTRTLIETKAEFESTAARRAAELDQQRTRYADLLK